MRFFGLTELISHREFRSKSPLANRGLEDRDLLGECFKALPGLKTFTRGDFDRFRLDKLGG